VSSEASVELTARDRCVLLRSPRDLDRWLERGYVRVPEERLFFVISAAFSCLGPSTQYADVWSQLFPRCPLPPWSICNDVVAALADAARGPQPELYVLERVIERGMRYTMPKFESRPLPPRTATEHYVVVEAVQDTEKAEPAAGVRLELLIADGEIRTAQTDASGVARIERIQAGRVVIRVLDLDAALWRPLAGEPARPSGTSSGVRWHTTQQGECLSKIAHQHNLNGWQKLWEHPKNAPLRKKRKNPHVLYAGDPVALPGVEVHELVRSTDATHRIAVKSSSITASLVVVFRGDEGEALASEPYELRYDVGGVSESKTGQLSGSGELSERLPLAARQAEVFLPDRSQHYRFMLGHLDPTEDEQDAFLASGVEARLASLGYLQRAPADTHVSDPKRALCAFQQQVMGRSDPSGELDAATCRKLEEAYGT
jgi:hypothetical protein